jgi:hypothetical protein
VVAADEKRRWCWRGGVGGHMVGRVGVNYRFGRSLPDAQFFIESYHWESEVPSGLSTT